MIRFLSLGLVASLTTLTHGATFTTSGLAPATNMQGENGYTAYHGLNAGDTVTGYTIPSKLDGIGAYLLDNDTVRLIVNHENTPAKISYIDVDRNTLAIEAASNAISSITGTQSISEIARFCSSGFWESASSAQPGATNVTNFADPIYLTGEEVGSTGYAYVLDPATNILHQAPDVGRASWENITVLDTRGTDKVALLMGDDRNDAHLYLYIGEKSGTNFLERNGLENGQVYVWKSDTAGETRPSNIVGGTTEGNLLEGSFVPLGTTGAFEFERPEDVATNPFNGSEAIFATTGNNDGDVSGALWTVDFGAPLKDNSDFTSVGLPANLAADITLTYDSDDNSDGLSRPDNLDWADDGLIYVQTDGVSSGSEGIFQLDPTTTNPDPTRIAYLTSGGSPTISGETSGILDISFLFEQPAGSILVGDTQATGNELFFLVNESLIAAAVPEPSRALLAAIALSGICLRRRRPQPGS
ncbi:MAG: DUF839 domain-containing protein [Verrucomicrobiales bacterium]|nr:DUF839 domain-containing protein [Verrucomicrobiales bacterium]